MYSAGEEALAFDENFITTHHQVTLREKILFLGLLSVFLLFQSAYNFSKSVTSPWLFFTSNGTNSTK